MRFFFGFFREYQFLLKVRKMNTYTCDVCGETFSGIFDVLWRSVHTRGEENEYCYSSIAFFKDQVNTVNERGETPLRRVVGMWVNSQREHSMTHWVKEIIIKVVPILLEYGADVNATDRYGQTSLHIAARFGNLECMKLLVECGADIHIKDRYECTPIEYIQSEENKAVILKYAEDMELFDVKEPVDE